MAYETVGEAFSRPYNEISRSKLSRERAEEYPEIVNMREQVAQARIGTMRARLEQMKQANATRIAALNEKAREFDKMITLKQRALSQGGAAGSGIGGLPSRYMTAIQKMQSAAMQIANNFGAVDENGNVDRSKIPGVYGKYYDQLMLAATKASSDSPSRQKMIQAQNLKATLAKIDPSVLQHYTGPGGRTQLNLDVMRSQFGNEPEMLKRYRAIVNTDIPAAMDQATKFWGTSITPEAQQSINRMIDASKNWRNNPQDVLESLNDFNDVFDVEAQNYSDAITDPSFYSSTPRVSMPGASTESVVVTGPSGKTYTKKQIEDLAAQYNKSYAQIVALLKEKG